MLNEYKKPMWNDGFAKDMPWLNYFNEYERTHCCFDGDGNDGTNGGELSDKDFEDYEGIGGKGSHAAAEAEAAAAAADQAATDQQSRTDTGEGGRSASEHAAAVAEAEGRSVSGIEDYEALGLLDEEDLDALGYEEAVDRQEKAEAKGEVAEFQADLDQKGLDVNVSMGPDGTWSYEGPDAWKAFGGELSKGIGDIVGNIGYGIGGLATAAMNLSPFGLARNLAGYHTPALHPDFDIGPGIEASLKGIAGDFSTALGGTPQSTLGRVEGYEDRTQSARGRDDASLGAALGGLNSLAALSLADQKEMAWAEEVAKQREEEDRNRQEREWAEHIDWNRGMTTAATGGQVGEEEEKTKSAMELYLEKLGQPSKYTVPTVPMDTPSMAPPPTSSDPFELAEYRKGLARETMGNYLPFDVGGASGALNTFNEDYYGGASNVSPYNMAQLASLLGLPRNSSSYEGIIGMLGGVRNEPPPPPPEPPIVEPEPPVTPDDPYDDEGGPGPDEEPDAWDFKHGGGIGRVLRRQAGGMTTHEGLQGFGMQSPRPFGITSFGSGLR